MKTVLFQCLLGFMLFLLILIALNIFLQFFDIFFLFLFSYQQLFYLQYFCILFLLSYQKTCFELHRSLYLKVPCKSCTTIAVLYMKKILSRNLFPSIFFAAILFPAILSRHLLSRHLLSRHLLSRHIHFSTYKTSLMVSTIVDNIV